MSRSIAINVGANTTLPGFRGPVYPDGRFEYVPIPEREPTSEPVPTYDDLDLTVEIPESVRGTPVHLDPSFRGVHGSPAHTYGDEHGVKAGPLSTLERGDFLLFYATLSLDGDAGAAREWLAPEWGAYLIGEFRVERAVTGDEYRGLSPAERERFATNAHCRREQFDARVLVCGDDESGLYDRAVPLSAPTAGTTANWLVTDLSSDSGRGPWWRRVLRFDEAATATLREVLANPARVHRRE